MVLLALHTPFSSTINTLLNSKDKNRILIDSIGRDDTQSTIAFSRILLLRWGAMFCQIILVVAAHLFYRIITPLPILILIICFGAGSNLAFYYLFKKKNRSIPGRLFALVMFLDIILLTALLHYTGGPMNPFTFLFLIHISLAAILMRPFWAWTLTVFTTLCYASLFYLQQYFSTAEFTAIPEQSPPTCLTNPQLGIFSHNEMALHLQGMWLAFAITVFFMVFFINKIQKDLEDHQKTLNELGLERNRSEKLASLATLAAGAAHEFSTPLATIAVASGEMLTALKEHSSDPELIDDALLIRKQVEQCREILYQMSADAGEHLAEALRIFTVGELCREVVNWFPPADRQRIEIHCDLMDMSIRMPFRTVKRIIRGLIKNSLEASSEKNHIVVNCRRDADFLYFEVRDRGKGMDSETLARAVEPFFTTKEPGRGLGLGLYLTKSAAERFGGSLDIESSPGRGTKAILSFSLEEILPG